MALTEDIRRLLGFDDGPESNAEIQFKIKPLGSVGAAVGTPSDPATVGAGGDTAGASTSSAGAAQAALGTGGPGDTAQQLPLGFGAGGQSIVPQSQQMRKANPALLTHPLGAQTDDMYEAAVGQLQFETQSRYAQLLQELGFVGEQGQFMPGTLETDAIRQRSELERQRGLSLQDVVESAVRGGTVFSGRRAQNTAQAQQPFDSAISEMTTRLSRELASRYQGLGDLTRQFELGRNNLLAEAAERIKAGLMGGPVGGEPSGAGAGAGRDPNMAIASQYGDQLAGVLGGAGGAAGGLSAETLNTMPPGSRQVYNPQVGYYVVDRTGRRIGRIVNGRFVNEMIPTGGPARGAGAAQ